MSEVTPLRFVLNGSPVEVDGPPGELLAVMLRERLGLTGTKVSCGVEVCGACTVLVDGLPVSSCCYLAASVEGRDVRTIEGAPDHPDFERLEAALDRHHAVQCGFCTPGFVMTVLHLTQRRQCRDREDVRAALRDNICRCTGYTSIVDAASEVLLARPGGSGA